MSISIDRGALEELKQQLYDLEWWEREEGEGWHNAFAVRETYRGRGMWSAEHCIGFVSEAPLALLLSVGVALERLCRDSEQGEFWREVLENLRTPQMDSLGYQSIVYFADLQLEQGEEDED